MYFSMALLLKKTLPLGGRDGQAPSRLQGASLAELMAPS
ncbi:hypothetical protein TCCBUS3UF1_22240 [Thermus sp. CCB_US3_UF1]|nr:hypothetical protein TCCBUS3UF1_22240 [Thermus sp. CCB_US3_UF1]